MMPFITNAFLTSAVHTQVSKWNHKVCAVGGSSSYNTNRALDIFHKSLDNYNLSDKMKAVNCFVPDSLVSCCTPSYVVESGFTPLADTTWTNVGFVESDLNKNGLIGDGSTKYLRTNFGCTTVFPNNNSCGASVYATTASNATSFEVAGIKTANTQLAVYFCYAGTTYFDCWNVTNNHGRASAVNNLFQGFITCNRTDRNVSTIYKANSSVEFSQIATSTGDSIGERPDVELYIFNANNNGSPYPGAYSPRRISFVAIHLGLTNIESNHLYICVQILRTNLGGGYV